MDLQDHLDLVDWRRRVGDAYRLGSVEAWRAERERLFRDHPQSPVAAAARASFAGLRSSGVVSDFSHAYHPSCVYDVRWACPLAPAENRLAVAVRAGERL